MTEILEKSETITEFRLTKKKFILNLIKLLPKMRKIRKRAEKILSDTRTLKSEVKVPAQDIIKNDLENICKVPHRRIGTKKAHEIEDYLLNTLQELGLESVKKEPVDVINWSANNWKLMISTKHEKIDVPCFYVLNTGFTKSNGITAPLVYVGHFATRAGLKVIHWIRSPYYLLTDEDTLDKIDMNKLHPTVQCITDLINSLMVMPQDKF